MNTRKNSFVPLLLIFSLSLGACKNQRDSGLSEIGFRNAKFFHMEVLPRAADNAAFGRMLEILGGWSCSATFYVSYSEDLKNFKGELRKDEKVASSDYNMETQYFGYRPGQLDFKIDDLSRSAAITLALRENCSQTEYESRMVYDSSTQSWVNENTITTHTLNLSWTCSLPMKENFNIASGSQRRTTCKAERSIYGDTFNGLAIGGLQTIDFDITLTNTESRTNLFYDNCGSNPHNPFLIRLEQGVGGWAGENDFIFDVKLDDNVKLKIPSLTGTLSEDILYCPPHDKDKVALRVSAVEEDLIFDDQYLPNPNTPLSIPKDNPDFEASINLVRNAWFGYSWDNQLSLKATAHDPRKVMQQRRQP